MNKLENFEVQDEYQIKSSASISMEWNPLLVSLKQPYIHFVILKLVPQHVSGAAVKQ